MDVVGAFVASAVAVDIGDVSDVAVVFTITNS